MAIIKCKMCGGDMELSADKTFGTCEYCGCVMTLPKLSDEQRTAAFNRGNHFRRTGEFDKALAVYERIVQEDDTDAEAHWCCALCRFGIEYVEDPATYEWIPTCHRASFDSILEDVDYLAAVEHSEGITRRQYQKDAAKIAEVQRGILATSQNEKPFDVFICYKESDEQGNRTVDSTLAQDIYYQLTEQGLRVFFARITLEDKVGSEYEPYIFAALHSAKVMVVGTKPEHFNAVWVKNEWSRYLMLVKKDRHKLILPCYRDMDPYDLPEQLSVLQSYDMSKIGFVQDLVRGIRKVTEEPTKKETVVKETVVAGGAAVNTEALLKRAFLSLEDGEWAKADDFCEQVLNQDPECAEAYLAKLLAELKVKKPALLADCDAPFDNRNNYQKATRFGNDKLKAEMCGYIAHINERNKNARLTGIYNGAVNAMNEADSEEACETVAETFKSINGFKDAAALAEKCLEKAEQLRRERLAEAEERRIAAEKAAKKRKKAFAIGTPIVAACIAFVVVLTTVIIPNQKYNAAVELMEAGKYEEAFVAFRALGKYKDASDRYVDAYCKLSGNHGWHVLSAGASHTVALKTGGTVVAVGNHVFSECNVSGWRDIVAVAAGERHTVCLKVDGTVVAVGFNSYGQCNVSDWSDIVAVAGGAYHTVGLKADGTVVAVGFNSYGQCNVSDWSDIVAVTVGRRHTIGLRADGTAVAVGANEYGQCAISDWGDIVAVAAGNAHTVGLKADGTVVAVGDNGYGQCDISDWSGIVAVAAGERHTVGLKADGTVVAVGANGSDQCNVSGWSDIVAVAAGNAYTVGLKADGTVVAVGANDSGQCDVSYWSDIMIPKR